MAGSDTDASSSDSTRRRASPEPKGRDDLRTLRTLSAAARRYFEHGSTRLLAVQLVALVTWRVSLGLPGPSAPWHGLWGELMVAVGIAVYWPLQEWALHQKLLHFKPREIAGFKVDPLAAKVHRAHHRKPWSAKATFLPLKIVAALVPINFAFWWFAMPSMALTATGAALFTLAAMIYEWIHYLTHTGYRPRGRYYKKVWRNHRLHHFKSEHYWHAFTVPAVDELMGTAPHPTDVETSPTVRTLGYELDD